MNFETKGGTFEKIRGFKNGRPLMAELLLHGRCFNAFLGYFTTRSRMRKVLINRCTVTISSLL